MATNMSDHDHDLLTRIEGEVSRLRKEFDKVSNGEGFNRCGIRMAMTERLVERVLKLEERVQWQDRLVIGAIILLAIKFLWRLMPLPSPI